MIVVTNRASGITITGHAEYAPRGQDIVCAAVSTLVQNLAASIEALTGDIIQYDFQPGAAEITYGGLSEAAQLLVDSFFVGVNMIADEYPENVKIINRREQ